MEREPLLWGKHHQRGALRDLRAALERAWAKLSPAEGYADADSPLSAGQCVPTALLIQELLGGEILRVECPGGSHYYNQVEGCAVDLTRDQFPQGATLGEPAVREREQLLASESVAARYRELHEQLSLAAQ